MSGLLAASTPGGRPLFPGAFEFVDAGCEPLAGFRAVAVEDADVGAASSFFSPQPVIRDTRISARPIRLIAKLFNILITFLEIAFHF